MGGGGGDYPDGSSGGKSVEFGGGDFWAQGILKEGLGEISGYDVVGEFGVVDGRVL